MRISDWSSDVCSSDLVLQYLAAGIARQWLCLDDDAHGTFERRQMFARPLHQFFFARAAASPQRNGSYGFLAQRAMRQSDDRSVDDRGMGAQNILHCGSVDILASSQDHEIGRASSRERVCQYV